MKKSKIGKMVTGFITVILAVMVGFSPITAFAQAAPESEPVAVCICEEKCEKDKMNPECAVCRIDINLCEGVKKVEEVFGPLTPDGNLSLVDDYGTMEAGGKQFITVVSKQGNYFYIIIDRDDEGDETVHFLNMVDEADLLKLMDDEEAQAYLESIVEKEEVPEEVPVEPIVEEEPVVEEVEPSKGPLMLLATLIIGGGIGCFYLASKKNTDEIETYVDPDVDYEEDEDILSFLDDEENELEDITEELMDDIE